MPFAIAHINRSLRGWFDARDAIASRPDFIDRSVTGKLIGLEVYAEGARIPTPQERDAAERARKEREIDELVREYDRMHERTR